MTNLPFQGIKAANNILSDMGVTTDEVDAMWEALKASNWKVKALSDSGKDWTDLPEPAVRDILVRYRKEVEQNG